MDLAMVITPGMLREARGRGAKTIAILAQEYPSIDGHIEAIPGAVVVVESAEGHRRIRLVMDVVCHLDDWPNQSVTIPPPPPSAGARTRRN